MKKRHPYHALDKWAIELQSEGRHSVSLEELRKKFPKKSEAALKLNINRLIKKRSIVSVYRGYYLLIPPQYHRWGILPAVLFIDGLMKYLGRQYYVSLLSAAAQHGAAHQQPQEYFVIIPPPALKLTVKKGIKINFINKKKVDMRFVEKRKTETGYYNISSPEMTAADLVFYAKRVGWMSRVATVLAELSDEMKPESLNVSFVKAIGVATLQKLGYLLDEVLEKHELAEALYKAARKARISFSTIQLMRGAGRKKYAVSSKWKIIDNVQIEIDDL
ncbi:MAG: hypothetical protein A3F72_15635 [Bacteroidetes bacterium RIFCSPLOWO2_12_FULL_35_15]|nr:MAG: hypothetical protein A3F72_15635 [Bacteroidetes bacterium RIFCSPLOWO2_12_FULL_35_15]